MAGLEKQPDESQADNESRSELDSLRLQIIIAKQKCTIRERQWLAQLPKSNFSHWKAAKALGMSSHTVWKYMRRDRVIAVLDLYERYSTIQYGVSKGAIIVRTQCRAEAVVPNYFNADGSLKLPPEWTPEEALGVQEFYFDKQGKPHIKLHDAKAADEMLAKMTKLVSNTLALTGPDGGPLRTESTNVIIETDDPVEAARQYQEMIQRDKPK